MLLSFLDRWWHYSWNILLSWWCYSWIDFWSGKWLLWWRMCISFLLSCVLSVWAFDLFLKLLDCIVPLPSDLKWGRWNVIWTCTLWIFSLFPETEKSVIYAAKLVSIDMIQKYIDSYVYPASAGKRFSMWFCLSLLSLLSPFWLLTPFRSFSIRLRAFLQLVKTISLDKSASGLCFICDNCRQVHYFE